MTSFEKTKFFPNLKNVEKERFIYTSHINQKLDELNGKDYFKFLDYVDEYIQ